MPPEEQVPGKIVTHVPINKYEYIAINWDAMMTKYRIVLSPWKTLQSARRFPSLDSGWKVCTSFTFNWAKGRPMLGRPLVGG